MGFPWPSNTPILKPSRLHRPGSTRTANPLKKWLRLRFLIPRDLFSKSLVNIPYIGSYALDINGYSGKFEGDFFGNPKVGYVSWEGTFQITETENGFMEPKCNGFWR